MAHPDEQQAIPTLGNVSAHDRGMADSYYRRSRPPHKIVNYQHITALTVEEFVEYNKGFALNEGRGDHKEYSDD